MKTILAATDFSKTALNAAYYAAELASHTKSSLILVHVYHMPIIMSEVPVVVPEYDKLEEYNLKELTKIEKKLVVKYGSHLKINKVVKFGFVVDEIQELVKKTKADLVVMGMHGAGYITEKLLGSNTTSLIQKAGFPVLIVHEKAKFKLLKKIAFASDFLEIKNDKILEPLKVISKLFKSHIYIVNILKNSDAVPSTDEAAAGILLENGIKDLDHSFHFAQNNDIIEGLNEFAITNKIDLTVMIPRKHSLLKNIFTEPTTKRMAFHTNIPLLTLHEN